MSQHEFSSLYIYSNIGWWWWWWWWGRKKMDNNFLSSPLQIVYTELWSFHLSHQIKYLDIVRQILFIKESNPPSAILLQSFHSTFLDREKPLTYVYVYSNLNFLGDISNPSKKLCNIFFGGAQDLILVQLILIIIFFYKKKTLSGHFLGQPPKIQYNALQCSTMYCTVSA